MKDSFYDGRSYKGYKITIKLIRENSSKYKKTRISNAEDVFLFLKDLRNSDREKFVSILLDGKNNVIGIDEISVGSVTTSLVHPREVLKSAILSNAVSIIIAHNHPSGSTEPSKEDIKITERLKECCELIGINLLDHIIIGDVSYKSIMDKIPNTSIIRD